MGAPRPPPEPDDRVECDVSGCESADVATLEMLARLQLAAHRRGLRVVVRGASDDLRDLLAWAGMDDALPCEERSGLEPRGQVEQGEQPLRVEEEADPGDPAGGDLDDL
jgi:nitroreductase